MIDEFSELGALKAGDEEAWTRAFHRLWPLAFHAARHPNCNLTIEEAEDAASEALGQMVAQIENVKILEELKPLVVTIAYRRAVSLARHKSSAKRRPEGLALDPVTTNGVTALEIAEPVNSNLSDPELRELLKFLNELLAGVDVDTRTFLVEKIGHGFSYVELSRKHEIPIGTVCAKVARGLQKLRRAMDASPAVKQELKAFLR